LALSLGSISVEAKSDELEVGEGVAQAKLYAQKLNLETTYSTNGNEIYQICLKTGEEKRGQWLGLIRSYSYFGQWLQACF
jgi:type I site-specific restriction endonuclease